MTDLPRAFHKAFGLPAPDSPTVPDRSLAALRLRLIKEEMKEVEEEFTKLLAILGAPAPSVPDTIDVMQDLVKELCDLQYVAEGSLVSFGVGNAPYAEVHRSNMSKLGADGRPIYRPDGKVLKGPNYTEADPDKMFPPIIDMPEEA